MDYPHWLIVTGALLLMLGLFGFAVRRQCDESNPPEMASNQAPSELEGQPTPLEVYNLRTKEKRRDRWAERAAPIGSRIDLWPQKESGLPEWQAAIETLMLCSRGGHAILADWRHAGAETQLGAGAQLRSQRDTLGKAEVKRDA